MSQLLTCHIPQRGILSVQGVDRHAFLQGILSQDIQLTLQRPQYAALLSPQGKFLHDMFVIDLGDHLLIESEGARINDLAKRLLTYKLRANVSIENITEDHVVQAFWGSATTIPHIGFPDPRLSELGFRNITSKNAVSSALNASPVDYDLHRLTLGVPDGSKDMIVGKSSLIECNLDRLNAISWEKGCYVGQELTARLHYRDLVKKRLYPVILEGIIPDSGSDITIHDRIVGSMRSSLENRGLALLDIREAEACIENKTPMMCQQTLLWPQKPIWLT